MITVFGATGFVGSSLITALEKRGIEYFIPSRDAEPVDFNLGDVIYCIGLTADYRVKPFETVEAHVSKVARILKNCTFDSLTYLSSTRVYINSKSPEMFEDSDIVVQPNRVEELYTLSKLTGENICLCSGKNVKIARLSNVIGGGDQSENFLSSVIATAKAEKHVRFQLALSSAKDYITIEDTVDLLIDISQKGAQKVYNISSGMNTTNLEIVNKLQENLTFSFDVVPDANERIFPIINNDRIKNEFGYQPKSILDKISKLL